MLCFAYTMNNIYQKPWEESQNYHARMESLIRAASLVVNAKGILEKHKKNLLDEIVWKATEAAGKSKSDTRYVSETVYNGDGSIEVHFEHVDQKSIVIKNLLNRPKEIKDTLYNAKVCTVTREEHKLLPNDRDGWERYKAAGIQVYDRLEEEFLKFA